MRSRPQRTSPFFPASLLETPSLPFPFPFPPSNVFLRLNTTLLPTLLPSLTIASPLLPRTVSIAPVSAAGSYCIDLILGVVVVVVVVVGLEDVDVDVDVDVGVGVGVGVGEGEAMLGSSILRP